MRFSGLLALAAAVISGSLAQSDPAGERRCAVGGVCVPFYLCKNGLVIEDGDGLIDKRFADNECPEDFLCCRERESECRGQCVPFYQCSNAGAKDLLNLRSFDDKCPGDLVCCNEPPVEATPCTCVAFYQCLDDVVNSGGKDLIDLRFSEEKCPGDEVCCVNPRPQDNTIVVESSCKGKCVPYALCPNKTSTSGLDLRTFDDCPNDQVCCESLPDTSLEVPKICDGKCVPFYQCPGGVPNTGGQHLINLRSDENTCLGDQICCSTSNSSPKPVISKPTVTESSSCNGTCVPFYQCPKGKPNTGGQNLLNLRGLDDCPSDLVCCESSSDILPKCEGQCVPFYQCPAGSPNTSGKDLLNLRRDEGACPGDLVCCKESSKVPETTCKGSCVPFYQCPSGKSNTGGQDLLNLRSIDDCPNDMVCCELNNDTISEAPPTCEGHCVPFYQCPAGSPNTGGQDLLNPKSDRGTCPGDLVCCKKSEEVTTAPTRAVARIFVRGGLGCKNSRSIKISKSFIPSLGLQSILDSLSYNFFLGREHTIIDLRFFKVVQFKKKWKNFGGGCSPVAPPLATGLAPTPNSCRGSCVPFYQCPQGQQNTGGKGLLNLRSSDDCPNDLVCCEIPSTQVSTEAPTICEGKCVPFYQCPSGTPNKDGQNILNLRGYDDSCPGDQVCCKEPVQTPKSSCKGSCVPFYQCPSGKINSGGKDLLNLRSFDDCPNDLVCCEAATTGVSTEPPSVCEGQCVPFYQCPAGSPNTGGKDLLNLRSDRGTCPGDLVCCKKSEEVTTAPTPNSCKGSCVPFYQCPQGQQNTGGKGLLNLRSFDDCPNDLVCCEIPSTQVSTEAPTICEGKCVPFYQCPSGTPNKDGQNILNLRGYDDSCPGDQVCCKEPVQTPKSSCKGSCVPFYQCPSGKINSGGKDLLNLRSLDDCPNDLVCCETSPTEVSTEPPSVCDGKCVPFYQCPSGTPNKDGQNILNLRGYDDSCPADQVCCKEPAQSPKSSCKGSCVPFYQCPSGKINSGGKDLLNLRSFDDCPNDLVCCETAPVERKVCQGQCVPSFQCMSSTSGAEDLLDLRISNDACPKDRVCCEKTEIIHMNPQRAMWMQWINDINGMQVIGSRPVKHSECSLQVDLNGQFAEQREVPWLVTVWSKVQYLGQTRDDYHCVGTVIRSDVVLVPADCVASLPASQLYVRSGNYNLKATDGVTELKVKIINIHPDYDFTTGQANIALLSLQSTVAAPSTACLANHNQRTNEQNCLLVGWTSLDLIGSDAALPRKHRLNLKPASSCRSDSLCIAGNTQPSQNCVSFHGSPLVCPDVTGQQWRVVGLVTRSSARCDSNAVPETLIKVSSLQPWISEQLSPSFVNKPATPEPSRQYLPGV
ncbi:uncharacterized protein LOC120415240 [Culex pipiens pallens]|uniref:uncharacterized protein LOC120415240 n=1 Tax=Culex pipiens pallens TaxID=42434 RepID=UPI0022AA9031|nr:uncharacterized protein LOC120415240 [Culex pipiens pallens]